MRTLSMASAALLALLAPAHAAFVGQTDDFEDGTTEGWLVSPLGMGVHPAPPQNVATGGPAGLGDNYLLLTSFGGMGAGSRLSAINVDQWTGDYKSAGIKTITMDLNNFGDADLYVRLLLENPMGGPPADVAISSATFLPAGSGWTTVSFDISSGALVSLAGSLDSLLAMVTALRIIHAQAPGFPGEPIAASLGVDNITAVPLPPAALVFALGLAALAARRRI